MGILSELAGRFKRENVRLDLDDIQGLILRSRPEPYVGAHAMLHIDEPEGGRAFVAELAEHVQAATDWANDLEAWTGVAISYDGLKALGVPQDSLDSFPLAFKQGMAGRSAQLIDVGPNAPEHWDEAFAPGTCHIALTIYAADDDALDDALSTAMDIYHRSSGVTLVASHQFGVDEQNKNPFGFRDNISQPTIAGSGVESQPGQERSIAAGEIGRAHV